MASDNFNRANETPPTGWTQDSVLTDAIGVVSNAVQNTNVGTAGLIYYGASSVSDSQIVYHGSGSGGPATNCDGSGNGYATLSAYLMYRFDAGASTLIAFFGPGAADGDVVRQYRSGNDVVANDNGSEILRATDTTYMAGHPGIYADYAFLGPIDDWTDGVAGGGGSTMIDRLMKTRQIGALTGGVHGLN